MNEFNWDLFKYKKVKIAVHCKNKKESYSFRVQMYLHGLTWVHHRSYLELDIYDNYKENTCYTNHGTYTNINDAVTSEYKLLEWSDYITKEMKFNINDLTYGRLVKFRNGTLYKITSLPKILRDNTLIRDELIFLSDNGNWSRLKYIDICGNNRHGFKELDIIAIYDEEKIIWERYY